MTGNRSGLVWRALAAVVLVVLLVAGGVVIYRLGWSQGHAVGEQIAQGDEALPPPQSPRALPPIGWAHPRMGAAVLITTLLGLFFFAALGKLLSFVVWGAMAGPAMARMGMTGHCPRHGHRVHGPVPPWYGPWGEPPGEKSRESGESANAET
ncbi:MAG: hypothetical protein PVF54_05020 [Anaerolineae bacterium]|jgi:hypothetical protein